MIALLSEQHPREFLKGIVVFDGGIRKWKRGEAIKPG